MNNDAKCPKCGAPPGRPCIATVHGRPLVPRRELSAAHPERAQSEDR